jgi:heme/copper-type cytochrome/quinol oxidase subunit 3
MKPQRPVVDVSALPTEVFGSRALTWWGMTGFAVIEGFTLALVAAAYLYVSRNFVSWPPFGTRPPSLTLPTISLAVMVLSNIPAYLLARSAKRMDRGATLLWLAVCAVLITAFLVFRWWEFKALNTRWDANAYASAAWNVLGFHATLIVLEWGEVVGFLLLMLIGPVESKHFVDATEVAGYWYFLTGAWVPLYVLVFLSPYLV